MKLGLIAFIFGIITIIFFIIGILFDFNVYVFYLISLIYFVSFILGIVAIIRKSGFVWGITTLVTLIFFIFLGFFILLLNAPLSPQPHRMECVSVGGICQENCVDAKMGDFEDFIPAPDFECSNKDAVCCVPIK